MFHPSRCLVWSSASSGLISCVTNMNCWVHFNPLIIYGCQRNTWVFPRGILTHPRHKAEQIMSSIPKADNAQNSVHRLILLHMTKHLETRWVTHSQCRRTRMEGHRQAEVERNLWLHKNSRPGERYTLQWFWQSIHRRASMNNESASAAVPRRHGRRSAFVVSVDTDAHLTEWSQTSIMKRGSVPRQKRVGKVTLIQSTKKINDDLIDNHYSLKKQ